MLVPGDPQVDEMLELAHLATASSFNPLQRSRWRSLCSDMLAGMQARGAVSERRRAVRGTASLQVSLHSLDGRGGTAVTSTVSAGGLSLRGAASGSTEVGSTVEIAISIPERRLPLRVAGEVVWSRSGELGIAFAGLAETEREMLEAVAVKALLVYGVLE